MPDLDEALTGARPWLGAYDPGVPASIDYPALRLDELLRRTADRYRDRPALSFFGRRTTYRELDRAVDRLAAALRRLGLRDGDRVALFMPNCPQLVTSFYAVWRAGGVVVPTNPRSTGVELARQLADSGAAMAIALDRLWPVIREARLPTSLRQIVVVDIANALPMPLRIAARFTRRNRDVLRSPARGVAIVRFGNLASGSGESLATGIGPDGPAALLYTGGTTGVPRAAVLTHCNLVANACQLGAWAAGLDDGAEVMLSALPLVHGYAMTACMNVSVLRGWTQVLVPDPRDIDRLLAEIERRRVTVFPGVPTLYAAICDHSAVRSGRRDLRSIEACLSGAATLPAGIQTEFERLTGGRLVEGYGLTEASPATHCNPLAGGGWTGSIGVP